MEFIKSLMNDRKEKIFKYFICCYCEEKASCKNDSGNLKERSISITDIGKINNSNSINSPKEFCISNNSVKNLNFFQKKKNIINFCFNIQKKSFLS